jgi:proteasome accessory factor A
VGKIDWLTKRWLLQRFCEQERISWNHPWLKSQDLEYHHIDPERSLGLALARAPRQWNVPPAQITESLLRAPQNTRAAVRSDAMRRLKDSGVSYFIDWEIIGAEGGGSLHLLNPFESNCSLAQQWVESLGSHSESGEKRRQTASS